MMKRLFSSLATTFYSLSSLMMPVSEDCWVQIDPVRKYVLGMDALQQDLDSNVWVLFCKKIDQEKFSVRFPTDPVCSYDENRWVFESKTNLQEFTLQVFNQQQDCLETVLQKSLQDFNLQPSYMLNEGKNTWKVYFPDQDFVVFLTVLENSDHIFIFQTQVQKNDVFQRQFHEKFVSSFSLF